MTPRVSGVDSGQRHLNGPQTSGRTYHNLSPAQHAIRTDLDVPIAVRDGARLLADVLRPDGDGQFPALVAASPYPRQLQNSGAPFGFIEAGASDFFVPRGYAHVLVNLRGTGGSDGTYTFFDAQERRDVHDVVEWVAAQPWCDGNVGMIGISGFAIAQLEAAVERPAHLRAVFPIAVSLDLYGAVYHHGVFSDVFTTGFLGGIATMAERPSSVFRNPLADAASRVLRTDAVHARFEHFRGESAIAALSAVGARHISKPPWDALFVGVAVDHPTHDEFWADRDLTARLDDVAVPCYLGCDWDNVPLHLPSTFAGWRGLHGRVPVRMTVLGSGGLTWPWESLHVEALAWFDHWLKGADTGILDGPPIRYWLPGANEWREATDWPPAGVRFVHLGLDPAGRLAPGESPPGTREYVVLAPGARRRPAPKIPRQLRWETQPFREPIDVVGPLELVLDAATTALDTVWMVTVQDVAPDGTATSITAGWLRAACREIDEAASGPGRPSVPCRTAVPVPPGEVLRYRIPLVDTAHRFGPGHRLALVLASDDRHDGPAFTGFRHAPPGPARQTIAATSMLVLPVLAGGAAFEPDR